MAIENSQKSATFEETKSEKFTRIAEYRTNKVIQDLRLLGNCSNKNNYDYTKEDVDMIFKAIDAAVSEAKSKFVPKKSDGKFRLKR